jgi:hypothetical protein
VLKTTEIKTSRIGSKATYTTGLGSSNPSYRSAPPAFSRAISGALKLTHVLSRPVLLAAILGFCYLGFSVGFLFGGNADSSGVLVMAIVGVVFALVWAAGPEVCSLVERLLLVLIGKVASGGQSRLQLAVWVVSLSMRDVRSPRLHSSLISVLSPVPHVSRLAHMYSRELEDLTPGSSRPSALVLPYAVSLSSTPAILGLSDALPVGLKPSLTSIAVLSGKRWSDDGLKMAAAMAPSWSGDLSDLLLAAESLV